MLSATYWLLGGKPKQVEPALVQDQMGHACEWETSMMLHLAPALVGDLSQVEAVSPAMPFAPGDAGLDHQGAERRPATSAIPAGPPPRRARLLFRFFSRDVVTFLERVIHGTAVPGKGEMDLSYCFDDRHHQSRASLRTWGICVLMLLATMLNYMDRLALSQQATEISGELAAEQQGLRRHRSRIWPGVCRRRDRLGVRRGPASARAGSTRAFFCAGRLVGFRTGWVTTYRELLVCRVLLGFFEAGQWPCALVTAAAPAVPARPAAGQQHHPERRLAGRDRDTGGCALSSDRLDGRLAASVPGHRSLRRCSG